ncbi:MAG: hypothetical protein PVH17_04845, partial [Anaerolineae bacterium]
MKIRANHIWWIVGGVIVVLIFAILAAIAGQQSAGAPESNLAPGESEPLRARVVEVVEESTVTRGEFEQPYQKLRLRITDGALEGQEIDVEHGLL